MYCMLQQVRRFLAKAHNEKLPLQNRELKFKFLDITINDPRYGEQIC